MSITTVKIIAEFKAPQFQLNYLFNIPHKAL